MQTMTYDAIDALARATGGGLLVAAFAVVVCRVFGAKLRAAGRFWVWWLVAAKFLLGLVFAGIGVTAVRVPVMDAAQYRTLRGIARNTVTRAAVGVVPVATSKQAVPTKSVGGGAAGVTVAPVAFPLMPLTLSGLSRALRVVLTPWAVSLAALYLAGMVCCATKSGFAVAAIRRRFAGATPCEDRGTLADAAFVAAKLGLTVTPPVVVSLRTSTPFVVGALRSQIVLPAALLAEPSERRRMALAHEMAHLKRGDLWLDIVPVALRSLFWFVPWAPGAIVAEIASAREEACDVCAVAATDTTPAAYAALLVSVAERAQAPLPALAMAQGASPGFRQVKRRLRTLAREGTGTPISLVWRGVAGAVLAAQTAATLLPLRPALARAADVARAVLPAPPVPMYRLTDLGTLGGRESGALGISEAGQVVGVAHVFPRAARGHAFLWDNTGLRDLTAGSVYRHSQAVAVADNGRVAGFAYRSSYRAGQQAAFLWNGTRRIYLPPATGYRFARAAAISDNGAVAGASLSGGKDGSGAVVAQATLWQNNRVRLLGTLGGAHSVALGVSSSGVVVGKADVGDDTRTRRTHPFLWDGATETLRDLGTLGGDSGAACAVSDSGVVVGYAQTEAGNVHAFATSVADTDKPHDLGTLTGYADSAAFAVSESGAVVGHATGAEPARAVVWALPTADPTDLNTRVLLDGQSAGWHLETARGVNRRGQIVGQGVVGGVRHAFLLTPVEH